MYTNSAVIFTVAALFFYAKFTALSPFFGNDFILFVLRKFLALFTKKNV